MIVVSLAFWPAMLPEPRVRSRGSSRRQLRAQRRQFVFQRSSLCESISIFLILLIVYLTLGILHYGSESSEMLRVVGISVSSLLSLHTIVYIYPNGPSVDHANVVCSGMAALTAAVFSSVYVGFLSADLDEPQQVRWLRLFAATVQCAGFAIVLISTIYHMKRSVSIGEHAVHIWRDSRVALGIAGYLRIGAIVLIRVLHPETKL